MQKAIQHGRHDEAHRCTRGSVLRISGMLGFCLRNPLPSRAGLARPLLVLLLALAAIPASRSQNSGSNGGSNGNGGQSGVHGPFAGRIGAAPPEEDFDPIMAERRIRALNMERQKLMVADTNKLFRLAKELNQEVGAENSSAWTADQLRKIAEIEKLAHSVKERMATGVGEAPSLLSSPSLIYPNH